MARAVKEPLIPAEDAIGPDARDRVPFAGLLAHEPALRDAELTREQWQELLQAYLFPGPQEPVEDEVTTEETDAS